MVIEIEAHDYNKLNKYWEIQGIVSLIDLQSQHLFSMYIMISYLFFGDGHVFVNIWEDSRFHEAAVTADSVASSKKFCSFFFALLDQIHDAFRLGLINLQWEWIIFA